MNLLCSSRINQYWESVLDTLIDEKGLNPVYWVGDKSISENYANCFYHNVWDAFSLDGCVDNWENESDFFDVSELTRLEYYNYLKILDRVDLPGGFTFSERDDLLKRQLSYWNFILNKFDINIILFSNAPHLPYDYPLYLCAKKLGIKVLMFNVTSIKGWFYLTDRIGGRPLEADSKNLELSRGLNHSAEFLQPFLYKTHISPWYMERQAKQQNSISNRIRTMPLFSLVMAYLSAIKNVLKERDGIKEYFFKGGKPSSFKSGFGTYSSKCISINKFSKIRVNAERKRKKIKREYLNCSHRVNPETVGRYIYFAMHYQPELTTTPLGGDASDQFYTIKALSKALPEGVKLVVKEHPSQFSSALHGEQGRDEGAWERVSQLDNTIISDIGVSSISLIANAEAIVTITGTVGWEAIVNKKPCIFFGEAWYQYFKSPVKVRFKDLEKDISILLKNFQPKEITALHIAKELVPSMIKNDIHSGLSPDVPKDPKLVASYIAHQL